MIARSPLRYPGGKSRAITQIRALLPEFSEYREPFAGGASVDIYLQQIIPQKTYWINDLSFDVYNFWHVCQIDIEGMVKKIYQWRSEFASGKELHRMLVDTLTTFNDVERASAFFVLNRITFSGTTLSGGYSEQTFTGRFTESSIERLRLVAPVLARTKITNLDYQKVVEATGKDIFLFLDPPYHSATKSALYGRNGDLHKGFDHERFAQVMRRCTHPWLITYDDSPYIRDLFSFASLTSWNLTYGMRNVTAHSEQVGKELFLSNYRDIVVMSQQRLFALKKESRHMPALSR